jgi:hypothetical protein
MGLTIHNFSEERCNTWGARVLQKKSLQSETQKRDPFLLAFACFARKKVNRPIFSLYLASKLPFRFILLKNKIKELVLVKSAANFCR